MSMEEWMGNNNSGVAIIRVSTHRQKDNSPDVQEQVIREYAAGRGIQIRRVERIVESAKDSSERVKFAAAIAGAVKERIRHVLFYMTDRECRNYTDLENNVRLIKQDKIVLHYAREGRLLWKRSPQSDFLMREFQTLQDKQVSAVISIKVNDAQVRKAESGWYPGNHPPLGYAHEHVKDEDGRTKKRGTIIVRDPDDRCVQQVIREFELRAQGLGYEEIRKRIVAEGYIPPMRVPGYSIATIQQRLDQPMYRGSFRWQGAVYKGRHPLIVPAHLVQAVDALRGERGRSPSAVRLEGTFSGGWLKCATCGCSIIYDPKKKPLKNSGGVRFHHYYHCTNGRNQHASMKGMSITEDRIFEQLASIVGGITISRTFAQEIADALNEIKAKARAKHQAEGKGYSAALEALEGREDAIYDDHKGGLLDETGYRRQLDRIRAERAYYTGLLLKAQAATTDAAMEKSESILELATNAKSLWESMSPRDRREFLDKLVSNPVLDGVTVRYEIKKPFAILTQMAQNIEWRPLVRRLRTEMLQYAT